MSSYLLDTSTCIHYLNGSSRELVRRVLAEGPSRVAISALSAAELYFGAARSGRRKSNERRVTAFVSEIPVLPFTADCAAEFGRIKAALLDAGTPIGDVDIAIAAIAVTAGLVVVTSDRDFGRVRALRVEDWLT